MSRYRCQGCRRYCEPPVYRKIGLGGVCSPECLTASVRPRKRTPAPQRRDAPPKRDEAPQGVRRTVYERDGNRCRYCGTTRHLHLHHIRYRSEGVDHSERNLIALCGVHHDLVHSSKRRWQPVLKEYIDRYYKTGRRSRLQDLDRQLNPDAVRRLPPPPEPAPLDRPA